MQMCTMPQQFVFTLIEFPLDSLYLVSLLSNLNARSYVRGNQDEWGGYLSSLKIAQRNTSAGEASSDDSRPGTACVQSNVEEAKDKPSLADTKTEETPESTKVSMVYSCKLSVFSNAIVRPNKRITRLPRIVSKSDVEPCARERA